VTKATSYASIGSEALSIVLIVIAFIPNGTAIAIGLAGE